MPTVPAYIAQIIDLVKNLTKVVPGIKIAFAEITDHLNQVIGQNKELQSQLVTANEALQTATTALADSQAQTQAALNSLALSEDDKKKLQEQITADQEALAALQAKLDELTGTVTAQGDAIATLADVPSQISDSIQQITDAITQGTGATAE